MPLPPRDFSTIGPREGERFPEIRLPDQGGSTVDLHAARGNRRALIVFYRSADWWPFCKTQLVQLQQALPRLEAAGVALFALSYDPVAVLQAFADRHGIAFPLLSDEGSHVIRRLGLVNERVQEDHAVYGIKPDPRHVNLPYPGVFVLDESGVIVGKRFHDSYRERDTRAALLAQTLGILDRGPAQAAGAPGDPVQVSAWLDAPTYSFFQRIHLNVELRIPSGFRVSAPPAPAGIVPLTIHVSEIPGVEVGAVEWPAAQPSRVPGTLRGLVPLTFAAPPGAGDLTLELTVGYQACSDTERLPPSSMKVSLGIKELAMVDRTLPASQGA